MFDWKYQMEAYLTTKDLWDIVDGTEKVCKLEGH
jgi:Domain of unknown function (DUF4219)